MKKKYFLFIVCSFLFYKQACSQCPNRDSLWNRLLYLTQASADFTKPEQYKAQLNELLAFESSIKNCGYRNDSTHALLLQRAGVMYARLNEYVNAIAYTKQAVTILKLNIHRYPSTAKYLVKNFYNLYSYYGALNKSSERMAAIDSCINTASHYNIPDYYYLFVLTEKVKHLFDIGDFNRCYQYALMGENITGSVINSADSINYLVTFLVKKVEVLIALKNYTDAERQAYQMLEECKRIKATIHLGALYGLLARVEVLKKNMVQAENYFMLALKFQRLAAFNLGCMEALNNLSFTLYDRYLNNMPKALSAYRKALGYGGGASSDPSEKLEALNILANIGSMYSRNGRFDSAVHYFQLAFSRLGPGVDENSLANHPSSFIEYRNIDYIILLVIDKGNAFLAQYERTNKPQYITEAIRVYKAADRLLNLLKREQNDLESKLFWRTNTRQLYEQAIEACFAGNRREDAFYFMEKSRAVLLSDQLSEQRLLGADDILMQTQVNRKINFLQRESADTATGKARRIAIEKELFNFQQQRDRLINYIKTRNPLYYQGFLDTGFISIADVQQQVLKDKQALVELFTGDSAVYLMTVTKNGLELSKIDIGFFNKAALLYTAYLSNPASLNTHFDSFVIASRNLYGLMFKEPLPKGRIIISPDVMYFPFESLVTSGPGKKLSYLIEDDAVSYTYSARYLLNSFDKKDKAAGDFLGLAPVKYAGHLHLAGLPGSDESLARLGSYFNAPEILLAAKATRQNFLQSFSTYKIVQLYTHASDSAATGEPVIYFADAALNLSELMPENKPATQLVVLSACETGTGKIFRGEGVFSFNRGFAALGIPSALANLWAVDNESTYRLTELFYHYLAKGLPADVALQKAKLDFIKTSVKEKQLPYYWAAPVITGKVNAFNREKKYTLLMILSVAVFAAAVFFAVRMFKKYGRKKISKA